MQTLLSHLVTLERIQFSHQLFTDAIICQSCCRALVRATNESGATLRSWPYRCVVVSMCPYRRVSTDVPMCRIV
eukprot:8664302-Pyramimonas_sp.AAC.1